MTKLEQLLYLADYIEPTREFDGVERLRGWPMKPRAAMVLGIRMSLVELRACGRNPTPARLKLLRVLV
jgi:nicotinate-nucleotide adenylyltransferase